MKSFVKEDMDPGPEPRQPSCTHTLSTQSSAAPALATAIQAARAPREDECQLRWGLCCPSLGGDRAPLGTDLFIEEGQVPGLQRGRGRAACRAE